MCTCNEYFLDLTSMHDFSCYPPLEVLKMHAHVDRIHRTSFWESVFMATKRYKRHIWM